MISLIDDQEMSALLNQFVVFGSELVRSNGTTQTGRVSTYV
jgi:hypothetical protein